MKIVLGISKFVYPNKADDTQTEDEVCNTRPTCMLFREHMGCDHVTWATWAASTGNTFLSYCLNTICVFSLQMLSDRCEKKRKR